MPFFSLASLRTDYGSKKLHTKRVREKKMNEERTVTTKLCVWWMDQFVCSLLLFRILPFLWLMKKQQRMRRSQRTNERSFVWMNWVKINFMLGAGAAADDYTHTPHAWRMFSLLNVNTTTSQSTIHYIVSLFLSLDVPNHWSACHIYIYAFVVHFVKSYDLEKWLYWLSISRKLFICSLSSARN